MIRIYKGIDFGKGVNCTPAKFNKQYAGWLKNFSDSEKKEAYKVAYNGTDKTTTERKNSNKTKDKKRRNSVS